MWIQCMRFLLGGGGGVGERGGGGEKKMKKQLLDLPFESCCPKWSCVFFIQWRMGLGNSHIDNSVRLVRDLVLLQSYGAVCSLLQWPQLALGVIFDRIRFPLSFGRNLIQWSSWGTVSERSGGTGLERRERVVNWGLRRGRGGGLGG